MAGPGKGLPKKTNVVKSPKKPTRAASISQNAQPTSPRRSLRTTPNKSSSGFRLMDEEVNDQANSSPRKSARVVVPLQENLSSQRNVRQRVEVNVEAQVSPRRSARLRQETNVDDVAPPEMSEGQRVQARRSLNLTTTLHNDDHILTPTSNQQSQEEDQMDGESQEQEEVQQTENGKFSLSLLAELVHLNPFC